MKEQNVNEKMLAEEIAEHLSESCAVSLSPTHKGYVVAPIKNFEDCKTMIKYGFTVDIEKLIEELNKFNLRVLKINNGTILLIVKRGTNVEIY